MTDTEPTYRQLLKKQEDLVRTPDNLVGNLNRNDNEIHFRYEGSTPRLAEVVRQDNRDSLKITLGLWVMLTVSVCLVCVLIDLMHSVPLAEAFSDLPTYVLVTTLCSLAVGLFVWLVVDGPASRPVEYTLGVDLTVPNPDSTATADQIRLALATDTRWRELVHAAEQVNRLGDSPCRTDTQTEVTEQAREKVYRLVENTLEHKRHDSVADDRVRNSDEYRRWLTTSIDEDL